MTELPRITALMPVRNGIKFLARSRTMLDSSLTIGDELIIINDNSNDGTSGFLEKWQAENSQVRVIKNNGNGLISSLQLGVAESHNSWIARYDVDDEYEINRLEIQRKVISKEVGAIFSDYKFFAESDISLGVLASPVEHHATSISLINGNRTPHPSVIFSKDAYLESGGYRASDYLVEDLSLWLRMSRISKLISVPEVLLNYRLHKQSVTLTNQNEMKNQKLMLLKTIGINKVDLEYSLENFKEIFEYYAIMKLKSLRQVSFLYDFVSLIKNEDRVIGNRPKIYADLTRLLLRPEMANAILKLGKEQMMRQKFR